MKINFILYGILKDMTVKKFGSYTLDPFDFDKLFDLIKDQKESLRSIMIHYNDSNKDVFFKINHSVTEDDRLVMDKFLHHSFY